MENNFFLVYTENSRYASKIEKKKINNIKKNKKKYFEILKITHKALGIFENNKNIDNIGKLLNNYWELKKGLSNSVTDKKIDSIYNKGINSGALGGKLLGAGGGGFILFYCPKNKHKNFLRKMRNFYITKFNFTNECSAIIHSN